MLYNGTEKQADSLQCYVCDCSFDCQCGNAINATKVISSEQPLACR